MGRVVKYMKIICVEYLKQICRLIKIVVLYNGVEFNNV